MNELTCKVLFHRGRASVEMKVLEDMSSMEVVV